VLLLSCFCASLPLLCGKCSLLSLLLLLLCVYLDGNLIKKEKCFEKTTGWVSSSSESSKINYLVVFLSLARPPSISADRYEANKMKLVSLNCSMARSTPAKAFGDF
jgi:hypothetical protein